MRRLSLYALLTLILQSGPVVPQVDRSQIQSWHEQGDQYLSEGLYESARREYQKVRDASPPQQRPAILQKVARCFYQQGKPTAAAVALKRAILLAPHSDVTRQLLTVTMENADQGDEAREWLASTRRARVYWPESSARILPRTSSNSIVPTPRPNHPNRQHLTKPGLSERRSQSPVP